MVQLLHSMTNNNYEVLFLCLLAAFLSILSFENDYQIFNTINFAIMDLNNNVVSRITPKIYFLKYFNIFNIL